MRSQCSYVLVRSQHLVALAMFVFVRADSVNLIRHVESSTKKTGLGGMAANKGGIGISFSINDTTVALVTAHLAAGQNAVEDRNRDYWTISEGLNFRGRRLSEHDMIFWFGDFNYRINMSNEDIRLCVKRKNFDPLHQKDQLNEQRAALTAFENFEEGALTFDPTYKYDNGTQTYDTSEKARAPAWTDRILYRGKRILMREYSRGESLISDHRPVRAVFELETVIIDRERQDELQKELYTQKMATKDLPPPLPVRPQGPPKLRKPPSTGLLIDLEDPDPPQQSIIATQPQARTLGFRDSFADSVEVSLPLPSSNAFSWWNREFDDTWIPNEGDANNPFYAFKPSPVYGTHQGSSGARSLTPRCYSSEENPFAETEQNTIRTTQQESLQHNPWV